jgi:plasmid stabilization system protein ParE
MPKHSVIKSLDAERDLTDLFDYIAADSGLDRAEAVLRRIDETLSLLSRMPRVGRVRTELDGSPRVFAVWPWLVIYGPQPDGRGFSCGASSMAAETLPHWCGDQGDRSYKSDRGFLVSDFWCERRSVS